MTTIHIIDDDITLCDMLGDYLSEHGFSVIASHNGTDGLADALAQEPALILLDVMLPGQSGFDLLRALRQQRQTPVLMLTARDDEIDRVLGLELGADDYVTKPFSHRELVARIQAILRRFSPAPQPIGELELSPESLAARYYGEPLMLTAAEFRVLAVLFANAGKIVDKDTLCQQAFGRRLQPFDRHIDIHISHIRKKMTHINPLPAIRTVRGNGYQLLAQGR